MDNAAPLTDEQLDTLTQRLHGPVEAIVASVINKFEIPTKDDLADYAKTSVVDAQYAAMEALYKAQIEAERNITMERLRTFERRLDAIQEGSNTLGRRLDGVLAQLAHQNAKAQEGIDRIAENTTALQRQMNDQWHVQQNSLELIQKLQHEANDGIRARQEMINRHDDELQDVVIRSAQQANRIERLEERVTRNSEIQAQNQHLLIKMNDSMGLLIQDKEDREQEKKVRNEARANRFKRVRWVYELVSSPFFLRYILFPLLMLSGISQTEFGQQVIETIEHGLGG